MIWSATDDPLQVPMWYKLYRITRCIICSISIELRFKSFYFDTLLTFSTLSDLPLIYLMRTSNTFDIDYNNPNVDWNNWPMWKNISDLCYGIGANKDFIVPKRFRVCWVFGSKFCFFSQNSIKFESNLIATAHSYGIKVHPWTFRNENKYLLYDYESDPYLEYEKFYQLGVDGYFTDFRTVIKISF